MSSKKRKTDKKRSDKSKHRRVIRPPGFDKLTVDTSKDTSKDTSSSGSKKAGKNGGNHAFLINDKETWEKVYESFDVISRKNHILSTSSKIMFISSKLESADDPPFSMPSIYKISDKSITFATAKGMRLDELRKENKEEYKKSCIKRTLAKKFMEGVHVYHNDLHDRNCFWCIDTQNLEIIDWDEATIFNKSQCDKSQCDKC